MTAFAVGAFAMADGIRLCDQILGHPITVTALPAGRDWSVTVLGGCQPHIGSVSLAEYEDGAVKLRTLLRASHKDEVVGDCFARRLAERCRCTVCVSCGIHFDGPTRAELEQIVACSEGLLEKLCQMI